MTPPEERAKFVLGLFMYELRGVHTIDQKSIEYAIAGQIHEALREQMCEFNKTIVNPARQEKREAQRQLKLKKRH